jgi:tetratricopeptide (TPR) repeat protein
MSQSRNKHFKAHTQIKYPRAGTELDIGQRAQPAFSLSRFFHLQTLRITTVSALLEMLVLGIFVYSTGLKSPFMGDDQSQIVNNPIVHSITNLPQFFTGSTFYLAQSATPLVGSYYRPLMITVFSALFSLFGANPLTFHALQLLVHILCAFVLFLVLRYFFKPILALFLALVFLVHPVNSQSVYSIAALQEPLFFIFGITAIWTLIRFQDDSPWYSLITGALLLLSLLSKETGALFTLMALIYLFLVDKRRCLKFLPVVTVVAITYLSLKIHAVGAFTNPSLAPIDSLNLWHRLLSAPVIITFYLVQFVLPLNLAMHYYFVTRSLTASGFWFPLLFVLVVVCSVLFAGRHLLLHRPKRYFILFLFFALWLAAGLAMHLQFLPLDETVSDTWAYFPIVGFLGMIGVLVEAYPVKVSRRASFIIASIVIAALGLRSAIRGLDYRSEETLATRSVAVSDDDYLSENVLAIDLSNQKQYALAKPHVLRAISIYKIPGEYNTLGVIDYGLADYSGAQQAYQVALASGYKFQDIYDNMAELTLMTGNSSNNIDFVENAIKLYPQDGALWLYLAIDEYEGGDVTGATKAIESARQLSDDPRIPLVYSTIMNGDVLKITNNP